MLGCRGRGALQKLPPKRLPLRLPCPAPRKAELGELGGGGGNAVLGSWGRANIWCCACPGP